MFREPEGGEIVETDCLADAPTYTDELNMDVQNISGAKGTYGNLYSANPPISVAALKTLSSNVDSRSIFQPKHPPFYNQISTHRCH